MGMGGNSSGFSMSFVGPGGGVQSSSFSRYKFSKNTKKLKPAEAAARVISFFSWYEFSKVSGPLHIACI
jgi:hypothetical protein